MNPNQRKKYRRKEENNQSQARSEVTIKNSRYSNEQQSRRIVQVQSFDDMEFDQKQKQYKFVYRFNEYVRLTLMKILPPKYNSIKINKQQGTIRGNPSQCEKLIKTIKDELQFSTMKVISVPHQQDIDEIEFHLNSEYQVKVFRIKYVELAAIEVAKKFNFKEQAENLIKQMKVKSKILIRLLKQNSQRCIQDINQIIGRSKGGLSDRDNFSRYERSNPGIDETHLTTTVLNINSDSSSISETEEQQSSFYKQKEQIKKESRINPVEVNLQNKKKKKSVVNLMYTLPQPTEDDSVSVVHGGKRRYQKKQPQMMMKKNKIESQNQKNNFQKIQILKSRVQLLKYELQQNDFSIQSFKQWLHQKKQFQKSQVQIQENKDPYDDQLMRYVIKLSVLDDTPMNLRHQKIQAFQIYFKFKKVIFIKMKNQSYKKDLIQEQESLSDNALTIRYVKGYKSPKWHQNIMWRHIINNDYSDQKKSANNEYFEAFFLQGLKDLVNEKEEEIRKKIKNEPLNDVIQEIMYKVEEDVAIHMRDNQKIKSFLKKHVQITINQFFSHICSVKQINFIISALKVILFVKPNQHQHFINTIKNQIVAKLKKQIAIHDYVSNFIIDDFTYQKLKKEIIIVKQSDKEFSFLATSLLIAPNFNTINNILNSVNTINQIEIVIKDLLTSKKISDKISELKSRVQFAQIKFNKSTEKNNHIFKFYGRSYILDTIKQTLKNYQDQLAQNMVKYFQIFNLKEKQVLNEEQFIEKIHEQHKIFMSASDTLIDCKMVVVSDAEPYKKKTITIKSTSSLDFAPIQSIIVFRSTQQMDKFNSCWTRTFKSYIKKQGMTNVFQQKNRNYTLMIKNNLTGSQMIKDVLDSNEDRNSIVMVMPEKEKKDFILEIALLLSEQKKYRNRQINILLLQIEMNIVFSKVLDIQEFSKQNKQKKKVQVNTTKYYVTDKNIKYYYSKNGNNKILDAQKRKQQSVILDNEDLNITHTSHKYIRQSSSICHIQSATVFPVQIVNGKVSYTLKNKVYYMPLRESTLVHQCINLNMAQIDLSLGVYQIKLNTMEQVNLFSGYVRKLQKEVNIAKSNPLLQNLQVHYNLKVGLITYQYPNEIQTVDALPKVIKQVESYLNQNVKIKQFSLSHIPNLSEDDMKKLKDDIEEEQSIFCSCNFKIKQVSISTLDETDFLKIDWKIKLFQSKLSNDNLKQPIKYPAYWQYQKQEIEQFDVAQASDQFRKVQDLFKVGKIKELKRIQNKIIYKKFYEQGQFLKDINGGVPVKTMQLFHGTRQTNPEEIYKDKEQSFNINYSSDSNLLGRGIYFAEKSEYSNDYRYAQNVNGMNKVLGLFKGNVTTTYSMFLCEVYVGQSEKCPGHNGAIKDTSYRDKDKKIRYQSMTDFLVCSNIFVVYKSRRAYPLYLIKY